MPKPNLDNYLAEVKRFISYYDICVYVSLWQNDWCIVSKEVITWAVADQIGFDRYISQTFVSW